MEESAAIAKNFKQKTPATISEEDLLTFNLRNELQLLRCQCPLLYGVLAGSMGLREDQLEVINIIQSCICEGNRLRIRVTSYLAALEQKSPSMNRSARLWLSAIILHILGLAAWSPSRMVCLVSSSTWIKTFSNWATSGMFFFHLFLFIFLPVV